MGTGMIAVSLLRAASPPVDFLPGTVEGFLPNGLHYLVLPNSEPVHNVELRLVMRVGSVQENESQKGAAHFLEHMAFVGTRHFPSRSMVEFLEAQGMKYGRDINAVTGYDRTVFMLSAPMGREDTLLLDRTLLMLRDWLDGITFLCFLRAERTERIYAPPCCMLWPKWTAYGGRDSRTMSCAMPAMLICNVSSCPIPTGDRPNGVMISQTIFFPATAMCIRRPIWPVFSSR